MSEKKKVEISERVRKAMENDIAYYSADEETGGFLLGYMETENNRIEVIEAVDGGYNARRESTLFEYDADYVEHVVSNVAGLYEPFLELVGVWHKHNHYHKTAVFSYEDMRMHEEVMNCSNKNKIVSVLYQKNGDEYIRSTYIILRDEDENITTEQVISK